jgi:hypothetical protein
MLRFLEMFRGMLVLRGVAAAHVSANEAQTQVNPGVSRLNAFLTYMLVGGFDFNLI